MTDTDEARQKCSEQARKAALARSPESRREAARKAAATRSPEQGWQIAPKAAVTKGPEVRKAARIVGLFETARFRWGGDVGAAMSRTVKLVMGSTELTKAAVRYDLQLREQDSGATVDRALADPSETCRLVYDAIVSVTNGEAYLWNEDRHDAGPAH